MINCTGLNDGADPRQQGPTLMEFNAKFNANAWNSAEEELGIHAGVQTSGVVYTVTRQEVEKWKWRRENFAARHGSRLDAAALPACPPPPGCDALRNS
jgi:hypothetical protein